MASRLQQAQVVTDPKHYSDNFPPLHITALRHDTGILRAPDSLPESPDPSSTAAVLRKSWAVRCIVGVILFVFNLVKVIPADEESSKIESLPDGEVNIFIFLKNG